MTVDRDAIVAALAGVAGISATRTTPAVIVAGAAWPTWASTRWLNLQPQGAREHRWFIYVALASGDLETTVDDADDLGERVALALVGIGLGGIVVEPYGYVVTTGGASIPTLRITAVD